MIMKAIINQFNPVKYEYTDKENRGSSTVIGLIAQDVEKVYPQAFKIIQEYIPSHMGNVTIETSNIYSPIDIHFIQDDKLKCINEHNEPYYDIVTDIIDGSNFTIGASNLIESNLFLIGQEIDDFHSLNENVLYTIGLSAIQELDSKVEDLLKRIIALEG